MSNSILGLANSSQRPNLHYLLVDPDTGWEFMCPPDTGWRYSKETISEKIQDGRIIFPKSPDGRPREKKYLSELSSSYTGFSSVLDENAGFTLNGSREVRELFGGKYFDFPKPVSLIRILLQQAVGKTGGIILDFFAGSGTTAQAVLELNKDNGNYCKFILVQLPESTPEGSDARQAGYQTIADISKDRVRRVIKKLNATEAGRLPLSAPQDRGFRVFKLAESGFKPWNAALPADLTAFQQQLDLHIDNLLPNRTELDLLTEILLKSGFPLTTPVETLTLAGKTVYRVDAGGLLVCLDRDLDLELIRLLAAQAPERVVLLDAGFNGRDALKTNAVHIFKDAGVPSFKTV